jgi:hypothetical protein
MLKTHEENTTGPIDEHVKYHTSISTEKVPLPKDTKDVLCSQDPQQNQSA